MLCIQKILTSSCFFVLYEVYFRLDEHSIDYSEKRTRTEMWLSQNYLFKPIHGIFHSIFVGSPEAEQTEKRISWEVFGLAFACSWVGMGANGARRRPLIGLSLQLPVQVDTSP